MNTIIEIPSNSVPGIAVPGLGKTYRPGKPRVQRNHHCEEPVPFTCEPTPRILRGARRANKSRIGTSDLTAWLAHVLRNKPAKEISADAGCGIRTAENVKQGRNALSSKHLANLQMNDTEFAAEWAAYVGLITPEQTELADALTRVSKAKRNYHVEGPRA
jgi:hypothetical protein